MARMLVGLACLALVLALVAGYVQRALVDSDQFANRATAALRDESVGAVIAQRITDDVVLRQEADLIAARPIIESVAAEVVGGRAFTELFRTAVRDVHRALFEQDEDTVTLTLQDVGTVLAAALERARPALARELESTERVQLVRESIGGASAALANFAERVRLLALVLLLLGLAFAAAALALSRDRRRTVVELGVGTAVGGIALVVAYAVARSVIADQLDAPDEQAAARAIWDAFLGDLRTAAWILAGSGAVVAAGAASLIKPRPLGEPLRAAGRRLAGEPQRPALRVARGLALVALGVLVLAEPAAVLDLLLAALGIYLIYEGVSAVLQLVYRPEEPARRTAARAGGALLRGRRVAAVVVPAVLIALAVGSFVGTGGTTTAAPAVGPCNGHEQLCDRRLDRVAFAMTHNSMSVPLSGWYAALQERPIADQLRDGVRGLMIDTHYGDLLEEAKVRTYFGSTSKLRRAAQRDGVSPEGVSAALRIRGRLGFRGEGERGMYLCHSFCELGFTPLEEALDDLRDFLVANPGEVVIVINQDAVSPEDFVGAVRDAGLEELAYRGPVHGRWPTLREMIDSGERVVFLAEERAGAAPWYRLAYASITQETPYSFGKAGQLTREDALRDSCRSNRGPPAAPIFLVNHWVTTDPLPRPSDAETVNARDALLRRARVCQRRRKDLPNLVSVNFYRRGDVFTVVDELNGVR